MTPVKSAGGGPEEVVVMGGKILLLGLGPILRQMPKTWQLLSSLFPQFGEEMGSEKARSLESDGVLVYQAESYRGFWQCRSQLDSGQQYAWIVVNLLGHYGLLAWDPLIALEAFSEAKIVIVVPSQLTDLSEKIQQELKEFVQARSRHRRVIQGDSALLDLALVCLLAKEVFRLDKSQAEQLGLRELCFEPLSSRPLRPRRSLTDRRASAKAVAVRR